MVEFSISTVGQERFVRGFNRYVEDIHDFSEVFEMLYKDFQTIEKEQFDSEGGRSEKWKALSPSYAVWKVRHHPGKPILVLSGALRRSLTEGSGETGNAIKIIDGVGKKASFGTLNRLAEYHQNGMGRLPVRKVVDLKEEDKIRWGRTIQTWAYQKLNTQMGAM
jgi:phage gpG-like protein